MDAKCLGSKPAFRAGSTPKQRSTAGATDKPGYQAPFMSTLTCTLLLGAALLVGCGTPAAKAFGGHWKPANQFPDSPTEIPLHAAYTFYASPMDGTLQTLLARWAHDTGRALAYRVAFDVTLYTPVSAIRTTDIQTAAAQLNSMYAAQGVVVTVADRNIVVEPASTPPDASAIATSRSLTATSHR